jgi:CHAT domain-containing protein
MFERLHDELLEIQLLLDAGQRAQAAASLATARRTAATLGHAPARAELALTEARVYDASGEARPALRVLDAARRDLATLGVDRAWEADALEARALARVGRLEDAVRRGRRAMATVEEVRARFTSGSLRSSYTSDRARVYADLVLVLLRLDRVDEAFQVADAARGRALLEHLAAVEGNVRAGARADLRQADQLLRRIDALAERLDAERRKHPGERSAEVEALSGMLADARKEYERMMQRISAMDPSDAQVLGVRRASGAAVRRALAPGEALVEYLDSRDSLIVFVVTRTATRSLVIPMKAEDLASRVRLARDLVATPVQDAQGRAVLSSLYDALIAPVRRVATLDGVSRLIIIPYGTLTYLPFSALFDAGARRFLVEDHAILMAPSASALVAVRAARQSRSASVAAFAPFPAALPATSEESRAAVQASGAGRSLVGARASEGAARAALQGPDVVHFATHGMFNVRNPMFSRVDLAAGDRGGGPSDDGRLEVHELLTLDIRSPLVFLSGCETGVGGEWSTVFRKGEDYVTLAQAFLFAGSRNVVGTLWRIDDRGAAAFAAEFYRALARQDPVDALASAQRAMLRGSYSAPFYWSGYTLNGSGLLGAGETQKGAASTVK